MKSITQRFIIFCDYLINNKIAKNYTDIAQKIGVGKSALTNIKSGRSSVGLEIVHGCVSFYETLNADWLIAERGEMLKTKTSPNSKEKEDVKKAAVNNEDVISLLKDIRSEQKRGFANLQSILSIHASVEETPLDELPYDELVKKAEKRRAELQSGKFDLKNQPVKQKEHK